MPLSLRNVLFAVLATLSSTACATMKGTVELKNFTPVQAAPAPGVIGPGDLVSVRVWNSDQMTTHQRVRPDGTLALFFMDSLPVAGKSPTDVATEITKRLDGIFVAPRVSVIVEESAANTVTILGEVKRPGTYAIPRPLSVLETLALASGLTEFARRDRILLIQGTEHPVRLRLRYEELLRGDDRARGLVLHAGDVIVVE